MMNINERNKVNYWNQLSDYETMGSWIAEPARKIANLFQNLFESEKTFDGKYQMDTTDSDESILIPFEMWLEKHGLKFVESFNFYHCLNLHHVVMDSDSVEYMMDYLTSSKPYCGAERTWNEYHTYWMHDHGLTVW